MDDVVIGAIELPLERTLERLDLRARIGIVHRDAQDADGALALDVRLITFLHDQEVHGVHRRQRSDDVAQLDARAPWSRHRAETGQQDPGHRAVHGPVTRRGVQARTAVWLIIHEGCVISLRVNGLIDYLRQHIMIDFQGDLTVAKVRELLAGDDSRDAKTLMTKLVAEKKVEDMMLVLADCLLEPVQRALTDDVMREQLRMYSES